MSASSIVNSSVAARTGRIIVWFLAAAVIGYASALRFARLDLQSYWVDENWSVSVASLPLADSLHTVKSEIHPPVYAMLLWIWVRLGGTDPTWTRSLSALFGVIGVIVSYWLLRKTAVDPLLRVLIVAVTAASGMAIVYAQEARSYGALWCFAVGVTAATLRLGGDPGVPGFRRSAQLWVIWGMLASSIHLFGSLLVACSALLLMLRWRTHYLRLGLLTCLAVAPQVIWLIFGLTVRGFAGGSSWIPAPTGDDIWQLATTAFAVSDLRMTAGGFPWVSPVGVIGFALALLMVLVAWIVVRRVAPGERSSHEVGLYPASLLGQLSLLVTAVAWLGSQFVHVWTLRNMIVVAPAITWAAVAVLFAVGRWARAAQWTAILVLALLTLNVILITGNLFQTYKTDHAGLMRYLAEVRAEEPQASFVGNFAPNWVLSSGLPLDDGFRAYLWGGSEAPEDSGVHPRQGTTVYGYWIGDGVPSEVDAESARVIGLAGGPHVCRQIPIYGLVVVRCENP